MPKRRFPAEPSFVPHALRTARLAAGLGLAEVGRRLGVSRQFVQQLETGERRPSTLTLVQLAELLDLSDRFLCTPVVPEIDEEEPFFRRLKRTRLRDRQQAAACVAMIRVLVERLRSELRFPEAKLPAFVVRNHEEVESAALQVRDRLGVGRDLPIRNLVRAVERTGILVVDLECVDHAIDAFTAKSQTPAVIVRSTRKQSPSRSRMDLAHELAHIVLHTEASRDDSIRREQESQADAFAGALLLPADAFAREFPSSARWQWSDLFRLKARWGASVGAMVMRASQLGLINPARARAAWKYMSAQGWRRGPEPGESEPETPELLVQAFRELFRAKGTRPAHITDELGWTDRLLSRLVGDTVYSQLVAIGQRAIVHLDEQDHRQGGEQR